MTGKHNTHNIIIIISDVISIKCEQCIRLLSIAEKGTDTVQCTNGGSELKPLLRRYMYCIVDDWKSPAAPPSGVSKNWHAVCGQWTMTLGQTIVPITSNWDFGGVGKWDWYASYWLAIGFWGVHDLSTANLRVHWLASPLSLGTPLQINNYRPKKSASSLKYWPIFFLFFTALSFLPKGIGGGFVDYSGYYKACSEFV